MTQGHVAFLLGTRQSNISAYEAGRLDPGEAVASRIAAYLDLEPGTAHVGTWAGSLPSHTADLRTWLAAFTGPARDRDQLLLRTVIGMNDAFQQLTSRPDRALFLSEPGSTGDASVDALLAGMAVHWCRQTDAMRVPAWTRHSRHALDTAWWIGLDEQTPMLRAQAFSNGIPSLRARGMFLDRRTLASV